VYLDAALQALEDEFGTTRRYLEAAAGVDEGRIELLRKRLLA
jgi:protein tyrosine/serine phosphatase